MNAKNSKKILIGIFLLVLSIGFISAIVVDSTYLTLYPGEEGRVTIEIENNENFDIEGVSIALILDEFPFTSIGSSERGVDDIDEDDDEKVTFTIRSSTDINPGDYNIPYSLKYINAENDTETLEKEGSFGIRVTAKTELDFSVEIRGNAIVGEEGRVSLEVINRGLGEIKSVSVKIFPEGFELLSKDNVFIGTVDADDTDIASFDVVYKTTNPSLSVRIEYKDFDNKDFMETVSLPFKVYTKEQALELGLIQKSNTSRNVGLVVVVLVIWFIWRNVKKRKRDKIRKRQNKG
ncbi:hypothetical protein LCGC14_1985070 [marine sediment metagenome]|uniref:Alpha-galactosidase NEW3 domain-containing protein n=1 Tax=marine sediment metagenome TaxID=412755 RepID=A0A0F9I4U7_9ZZZZ